MGCFAGCGKEENSGPRKDIYLKVTDNQGNSFFIGKNHTMNEKDVEYDGKHGDLNFYEAYYETGERCAALPEISFDQRMLPMDKPKVYPLQQIYPFSEGSDVIFKLNVTVKEIPDERPVPVVEVLPDEDCSSYEMNKKYVYKYDGEYHRPTYCKAYDPAHGDFIAKILIRSHAFNSEIIEGDENNQKFIDVDVYKFDLYINAPGYSIGGEDSRYAKTRIDDIIIEIIP